MPHKDPIKRRAYESARYAANGPRYVNLNYNKERYAANRDKILTQMKAYNKARFEADPEAHRARVRARYRAMSREQKAALLTKHRILQNADIASSRRRRGLPEPTRPCPEICERPGCGRKANTLDHDHKTGLFRSWLCRQCNAALGCLGDTAESLQNFADFLRR